MPYLAKDTVLGKLEMLDTYEYYDCPRLFSCKNQHGQYFIALSIEERKDCLLWFYAQVTQEKLKKVEKGEIELYDVFKKAEKDFIFGVKTFGKGLDEVEIVSCKDIPDKFLPVKGETLALKEKIK